MKFFFDFFIKSYFNVCLKMSDFSEKKMKEVGVLFYCYRYLIVCK